MLIGVAAISARIAVATPLSLVVVGIGLSFLPGLPAITFLLENGIFLLMGLQLKTLVDAPGAAGLSVSQAVWSGLAGCGAAVVLRMACTAPLVAAQRHDAHRAADMKPARWRRCRAGPRPLIPIHAAETLPEDTPLRPQVILIAFVVAGTTLLAQGLSPPLVIRSLKIPGADPVIDRAEYAQLISELSARVREAVGSRAAFTDRTSRARRVPGSSNATSCFRS